MKLFPSDWSVQTARWDRRSFFVVCRPALAQCHVVFAPELCGLVSKTKWTSYVFYMNSSSPDAVQLLRLFQKVAPAQFFYALCQKHGYGFRQGIYTPAVVVWLMIWQRLAGDRGLAASGETL